MSAAGFANDLYAFDTAAREWRPLNGTGGGGGPPSARAGFGLAVVAGALVVFGGQGPSNTLDVGSGEICADAATAAADAPDRDAKFVPAPSRIKPKNVEKDYDLSSSVSPTRRVSKTFRISNT